MSRDYAPVGPFDPAVVAAVQAALEDEASGFARLGRPVHAPKVLRALLAAKVAPAEPPSGGDEVYISSDPTYGLRVFGHRGDAEAYNESGFEDDCQDARKSWGGDLAEWRMVDIHVSEHAIGLAFEPAVTAGSVLPVVEQKG